MRVITMLWLGKRILSKVRKWTRPVRQTDSLGWLWFGVYYAPADGRIINHALASHSQKCRACLDRK